MNDAPIVRGEWVYRSERGPKSFWQPQDWWVALTTTLGSLLVYLLTMAPSVTFDNSGELVTVAWHGGVARAPGHPFWTMVTFLWTRVFLIGNVAWRVNLLSALWAALASGLTALLVSRSGRVLAAKLITREESFQQRLPMRAAVMCGMASGWLLAFCPALWSQAEVASCYPMSICLWMAVLVGMYRWSFEPGQRWRLYLAALLWGLSLSVNRQNGFAVVALAFYVWRVDRALGRDLLAALLSLIVIAVGVMVAWRGSPFHEGAFSATLLSGVALLSLVWLWFLFRQSSGFLSQWRGVAGLMTMVALGLSCYLYVLVVSSTNPPLNGGCSQTLHSFLQHLGSATPFAPFRMERAVLECWAQVNVFLANLLQQFNIVFAVIGLLLWFFFRDLTRINRDWLWFLLLAFLSVGFGFVLFANPSYERSQMYSYRAFFLPAYGVFVLMIGYSLVLVLVTLLRERLDLHPFMEAWLLIVIFLPVLTVVWHVSACSQRDHTYAYGYGYRIFQPGGGYPEMNRGAVIFTVNESSRFVPPHMVFVESQSSSATKTHIPDFVNSVIFDRRDVCVVASENLADPLLLHSLRNQYGVTRPQTWRWLRRETLYPTEALWLPSETDRQEWLRRCLQEPGAGDPSVDVKSGHFHTANTVLVSAVNGGLGRMIFEQNRQRRAFYVEGGEAQSWMYPNLEPYGVIMRLQPQPAILDPSIVGRDRRYWDELVQNLMEERSFRDDMLARSVYGRARAAIGGVYAFQRLNDDAEYAYHQALRLCPDDVETARRLAKLYVDTDRFDAAEQTLTESLGRNSYNMRLREALATARETRQLSLATVELETQHNAHPDNLSLSLQLFAFYSRRQRVDAMDALMNEILAHPALTATDIVQMADIYGNVPRLDRTIQLLRVCLQRFPSTTLAWYNLAAAHALRGECADCMMALGRAFAMDGPAGQLRAMARQDTRLERCRRDPLFQKTLSSF